MPLLIPIVLLWVQVQFGALRVLVRLPGGWGEAALAVVWIASAVLAWALLSRRLPLPRRALRTPWPAAILVVLVAVCALAVYPEVDARRSTGGGSDADDAALVIADRVRHGLDPYEPDTYLGNPPTTGPGSTIWTLPLSSTRTYGVGMVVAVVALLAGLRRFTGGWSIPSVTALLLGASVPFWEGIAQGNDHLTMACLLALVVTGVRHQVDRVRPIPLAALAAAAGVLATWRAAYLHLPVLLAIALWRRSPKAAVAVAVGGTGVALALHLALLSRTAGWDAYDPVQQLVVKSDEDLTVAGRAVLVAGVVAAGFVVLAEARRQAPRADVLVLAGLGGPLAAIAVVGAFTAADAAGWSEASYLLPTLVVASVLTARCVLQSRAP